MSKEKKIRDSVTLFAAIERKQHEALRYIAYKENRSIAEITREALDNYIKDKSKKYDIVGVVA
jgi:hypothetical protein